METKIFIIKNIVIVVIAVLVPVLYIMLKKNRIKDNDILEAKKIIQEKEKQKARQKASGLIFAGHKKEDMEIYLSKYGVNYRMGKALTAVDFFSLKISLAFVCGMMGIFMFGAAGIIGAIIGYMLPRIIFEYWNNKDNEKMLPDIKALIETMLIKQEGGMFLSDCFEECRKIVKNRRLKNALLELNSELTASNDLETALEKFQLKFNNNYIDDFCIAIEQYNDTGKSLMMLNDLSRQLEDIGDALNEKKQNQLDGRIQLNEILLYIGILGVCMYITLSVFKSTMG